MKKIILIILLFTSFLSASINEYLSDVYFANGIDTKEKSAYKALSEIQDNFELNYPNIYQSVSDWNISYNHTHGIGIDLYESFLQKIYEDKTGTSIAPFIWNVDKISGLVNFSFRGVVKKVAFSNINIKQTTNVPY